MRLTAKSSAVILSGFVIAASVVFAAWRVSAAEDVKCDANNFYCVTQASDELGQQLASFKAPEVSGPAIAGFTPHVSNPVTRTVTYDISTRGNITIDFNDFKTKAQETYDDSRGWQRLGVRFQAVTSGGDFTLVLSEASQVPSFGYPCDSMYSCNIGRYVIINQDRWQGATPSWNNAGGDLRNYRHMVVNHETGHWLGHGHLNNACSDSAQPAPVMMQQSINLMGCKFNPWPLDGEVWSSRLGI